MVFRLKEFFERSIILRLFGLVTVLKRLISILYQELVNLNSDYFTTMFLKSRKLTTLLYIIAGFCTLWLGLTLVVQNSWKSDYYVWKPGEKADVLILYHPDLFYAFDRKMPLAAGETFLRKGYIPVVDSYDRVSEADLSQLKYLLIITNTYNWSPDWPTQKWLEKTNLNNKKVIAVTLGAGSTASSWSKMNNLLASSGAEVILTTTSWLLKPNDESRMKEDNVLVAIDQLTDQIDLKVPDLMDKTLEK